jgi:hypothetical protein
MTKVLTISITAALAAGLALSACGRKSTEETTDGSKSKAGAVASPKHRV